MERQHRLRDMMHQIVVSGSEGVGLKKDLSHPTSRSRREVFDTFARLGVRINSVWVEFSSIPFSVPVISIHRRDGP
jgi:hypothetical protein